MRLAVGLSNVANDGVLAAPAERMLEEPMLGLALRRDSGEPLGAFRVVLLVQGREETLCEPIDDSQAMQHQFFKVTSKNVKCLLSEKAVSITLQGYSDFKKIMAYRLDSETALVLASAITCNPGDGEECCVVSVEHMQKVSQDEKAALVASMGLEWKSVLQDVPDTTSMAETPPVSSKQEEYWSEQRTPKVRRMQSEPQSPGLVRRMQSEL